MSSTITDRSSGLGAGAIPNGENATISQKVPCRVATTANITLSGLQVLDAVTVEADDRVLVKDQTDAAQNGIYLAGADVWRRSNDCVDAGDLVRGSQVRVNEGASGAGSWYCISDDPIIIGADDITWVDVATTVLTGAEIKALYEAEAETNAFEDADTAKLDGIEPGADVTDTANVSVAGALMDSEVANLTGIKSLIVPDNTIIEVLDFDTKSAVEAANIPASVDHLRIAGYTSAGDGGGARYVRVDSEPSEAGKIQSNDNAWWELAEPIVSVLMLGAVGDGSTDDSIEFSNAVAVAGEGGVVVVPGGRTYSLAARVDITQQNLKLIGLGRPVLKRDGNINPIRLSADGIEVRGFGIDGNKGLYAAVSSLIRVESANNCKVTDNECRESSDHGISLDGQVSGCANNWVTGNNCHSNNGTGIATNTVKNTIIVQNTCNGNAKEGITVDVAAEGNIVAFNRLDGNCASAGVAGIGVDDADKNVVACNIVTDSPSVPGIKTQNNEGSSQRNAFIGNVLSGNGTYGMHLATNNGKVSIENTAIGNVLYNNTFGALKVDASSVDNVMAGNVASREDVDVVNQNHTITEPVSFMVSLGTTQINVTGNGTLYKVPFNTEVRDFGDNFDLITNNNFTAPVTGRYIFSGGARVEGGASTIEWVQVVVVTSNRSYRSEIQMTNESVAAPTICIVADMQRGDTAHLSIRAGGMGVDNAEVSNDTQQTFFSGELLG